MSTIRELTFTAPSTFFRPILICRWLASKRQRAAMWFGGTELRAASDLSTGPPRPDCPCSCHQGGFNGVIGQDRLASLAELGLRVKLWLVAHISGRPQCHCWNYRTG